MWIDTKSRSGHVYTRTDRNEQARPELEKAVALDQGMTEAYWLISRVYLDVGEKEKAQEDLAAFHRRQSAEYEERQEILRRTRQRVTSNP